MDRNDITDAELRYIMTKRRMKRYKKEKKEIEFSKKMIFSVILINYVVIFFTLLMVWKTGDLSPLPALFAGVFGLGATAFGFYYYKASKENVEKIKGSGADTDPPEQY